MAARAADLAHAPCIGTGSVFFGKVSGLLEFIGTSSENSLQRMRHLPGELPGDAGLDVPCVCGVAVFHHTSPGWASGTRSAAFSIQLLLLTLRLATGWKVCTSLLE